MVGPFLLSVALRGRLMPERELVVLRSLGKIPTMAGCSKCGRKFFAPASYSRDPVGAHQYLSAKFDRHSCMEGDPSRGTRLGIQDLPFFAPRGRASFGPCPSS